MENYPDQESGSVMTQPSAEKPKAPGKMRVESVRIEPSANGGYIVNCQKVRVERSKDAIGPGWESPKPYVFGDLDEALDYVRQEFGAPSPTDDPEA